MPNWCQNVIYVSHEDENKMVALKDAIINGEMCDHIKPMPEALKDTTSPSDSPNWYDWACDNWGTKWDVCSPWDTDEIYSDENGETYVFKFDTAWSPPIPVYDEMIKQGFHLVARYVEYGCGYHGEYSVDGDFYHNEIQNGDEIDEHLQSEYA
tara:strand:- start:19 stop:477 length:459 start_codon:yes stop_codon:yes gene_type:complete